MSRTDGCAVIVMEDGDHRGGVELWWLIHLGLGILADRLDWRVLGEDRGGNKKGHHGNEKNKRTHLW